MRKLLKSLAILSIIFVISCQSGQIEGGDPGNGGVPVKQPSEYNFKFIGVDTNIINPENDRRSFYKVIIDKIDTGFRTSIGLESQNKVFVTTLSNNKHLLRVEKHCLNLKKGKYEKLNNIEQPKPAFTYFDIPEGRVVVIKLIQNSTDNTAEIIIEYED